MKILILSFIFSLSITSLFADESGLVAQYPTLKGTYKQLVFENVQNAAALTCTAANQGLIYVNPSNYNFEICASLNTIPVKIPYLQECFARFQSGSALTSCPSGWIAQSIGSGTRFNPCSGGGVCTTYVNYCCSNTTAVGGF